MRDFLENLLMTEPQWHDEGQGRYVKKRRLRGSAKAAAGVLGALVLAAAVGLGMDLLGGRPEETPAPPQERVTPDPQAPLAHVPNAIRERLDAGPENNSVTVTTTPVGVGGEAALAPGSTPAPTPAPRALRDYWIRVSKGDYTLSLYRGNEVVKTYSVAVGENPGNKQYVGDHRTPEGNFRIVSIENASRWKHDFHDGKGPVAGAYGPWFLRLDAGGWKGIGIHGTHDPDSRGTMASEGCIRMLNEDIQELRNYAYRNMRVVIEN